MIHFLKSFLTLKSMENSAQKKNRNLIRLFRWSFIIFLALFTFSISLGLAPIAVREISAVFFSFLTEEGKTSEQKIDSSSSKLSKPVRLVISSVGIEGQVLNPEKSDIKVLDEALLKGAVRYPGSGTLESSQNILIFGHSSDLKVIHNQNFKIFNGLKFLKAGDEIKLYSENKEYVYKVDSVRLAMAEEEKVTFSDERKLILSTCNTFGAKEERYVVEAIFVGSYPILN